MIDAIGAVLASRTAAGEARALAERIYRDYMATRRFKVGPWCFDGLGNPIR